MGELASSRAIREHIKSMLRRGADASQAALSKDIVESQRVRRRPKVQARKDSTSVVDDD